MKISGLNKDGIPSSINYHLYDLIACSKSDPKFNSFFFQNPTFKKYINNALCIDPFSKKSTFSSEGSEELTSKDYFVFSTPTKPPFQKIQIMVYPCSLPNPITDCAPVRLLPAFLLAMGKIDYSFNPFDINNPVQKSSNMETMLSFTPETNLLIEERFRLNNIYDEKYDFLGNIHKESFFDIIKKEVRPTNRRGS